MAVMRNSEATRARLVQAVGEIANEEGFGAIGVRSIARRAGADKALIYRYFGGMSGLLSAYAEEGDFWWKVEDVLLPVSETDDGLPAALAHVFRAHVSFLRSHPITLELIAWELHNRNELTEALEGVREVRSLEAMRRIADQFGYEHQAFNERFGVMFALMGAAANHLAARSRRIRMFNGIDIQSDEGWRTILSGVETMIAALCAQEMRGARR